MITEDEIRRVAKLMRIEADDYTEYVDKVHAIIDYFGILDSADVMSEEITVEDVAVTELREDKHVPFQGRLIEHLKQYRGGYVRAPKVT